MDAWGKLPSALLDGNLYDFGGFSECFRVKRNDVLYGKSKYCMGQILIDLNGMIGATKPRANDVKHVSNIIHTNALSEITPRFVVPQ